MSSDQELILGRKKLQIKKKIEGLIAEKIELLKEKDENGGVVYLSLFFFVEIALLLWVISTQGNNPIERAIFIVLTVISFIAFILILKKKIEKSDVLSTRIKNLDYNITKSKKEIVELDIKLKEIQIHNNEDILLQKNRIKSAVREKLISILPYITEKLHTTGIDLTIFRDDICSSFNVEISTSDIEEILYSFKWKNKLKQKNGTDILYINSNLNDISSDLSLSEYVDELDDKFEEWSETTHLGKI